MKLYEVHQRLTSHPLPDVAAAVREQLEALNLHVPPGDVAITAGSRGIAHIAAITKAVGQWLREQGARPFLVPCMGSHNGGTAEGQRRMLESLGLTEQAMQMPIRASMDCVKVAEVASGPVWMDRQCHQAAAVVVVNRIKLHTSFSGPIQSGLLKMMVVGMGKTDSAKTFHSAPASQQSQLLVEMGQAVLASGKILAGVGILEDGLDQTAEIHALPADQILAIEPQLLDRCRAYFPRLPVDQLNVLIVDTMGKTYSGTGMDTNIIGRRGLTGSPEPDSPRIGIIGVLQLAEESQGNALGIGLADFITARCRAAIDEHKTLINVLATGQMSRMKIPATLADDQSLIETIRQRFGGERWMFIRNTLQLEQLFVSTDLREELQRHSSCDVHPESVSLTFRHGIAQLFQVNGSTD